MARGAGRACFALGVDVNQHLRHLQRGGMVEPGQQRGRAHLLVRGKNGRASSLRHLARVRAGMSPRTWPSATLCAHLVRGADGQLGVDEHVRVHRQERAHAPVRGGGVWR
jgi:hypothetical protein